MIYRRMLALFVLVAALFLGIAIVRSEQGEGFLARYPFKLGLDLSGGSHLLYKANVTELPAAQIDDSMESLRDVIERRINMFGVGEPVVTVETSSLGGGKEYRLSVDLPGVTEIEKAIEMIGATPYLEFRTESL